MLKELEKTIARIKKDPKDVNAANVPLLKAQDLAKDYGLKKCFISIS